MVPGARLLADVARAGSDGDPLFAQEMQHDLASVRRGAMLEQVAGQNIATGLLTAFCRHTSASLLIQENADPDVRTDLETFFEEIAPEDIARYVHRTEGP